jgi:hypothetical protein
MGGTRRLRATEVFDGYSVSACGHVVVSLFETTSVPRVHIALDGLGQLERQATVEQLVFCPDA